MADRDSIGRVITQTCRRAFQTLGGTFHTLGRSFQTLGGAFSFFLSAQKSEKLG